VLLKYWLLISLKYETVPLAHENEPGIVALKRNLSNTSAVEL